MRVFHVNAHIRHICMGSILCNLETNVCYLNNLFKRNGLAQSSSAVIYYGFILESWLMFYLIVLVEDNEQGDKFHDKWS